jgi:hypothetical protein
VLPLRALDATLSALEENLLGYALWCYEVSSHITLTLTLTLTLLGYALWCYEVSGQLARK